MPGGFEMNGKKIIIGLCAALIIVGAIISAFSYTGTKGTESKKLIEEWKVMPEVYFDNGSREGSLKLVVILNNSGKTDIKYAWILHIYDESARNSNGFAEAYFGNKKDFMYLSADSSGNLRTEFEVPRNKYLNIVISYGNHYYDETKSIIISTW